MEIPIKVLYKQAVVGDCYADVFVDGCVIVEVKVALQLLKTKRNYSMNSKRPA